MEYRGFFRYRFFPNFNAEQRFLLVFQKVNILCFFAHFTQFAKAIFLVQVRARSFDEKLMGNYAGDET